MPSILVIGETILDFAPAPGGALYEPVLGGSAFNTARAMGALGAGVSFSGAVSGDAWGARFRTALIEQNVDCALLRDSEMPMPLALVSPEGAQGPAFTLYLAGTAHEDAQAPGALTDGVTHLHASSFHACTPPTGDNMLALMRNAKGRASISFDPNVRPGVLPSRAEAVALIEERVALADIVKASAQDMAWLYPGLDPLQSMESWSRMGPRLAVLTQGPGGATAFSASARVQVSAPAVAVIDTVGAGDAFTAALLAEMERDGALGPGAPHMEPPALKRWLSFAAAAASWTCGHRGAQAPRRETIAALAPGGPAKLVGSTVSD
ncbi:MAG: PfkB family carbohydrate kinase [Beijerinckiaceae bacterium]